MKIRFYLMIVVFTVLSVVNVSCDKDDDLSLKDVPEAVKSAFSSKYPNVSANWEKDRGMFKAEFLNAGKDADAWFSEDGKWLRTETMYIGQLSDSIIAYITTNYQGYVVDYTDVKFVEVPEDQYYLIELDHNSKPDIYLSIKDDGTVVL